MREGEVANYVTPCRPGPPEHLAQSRSRSEKKNESKTQLQVGESIGQSFFGGEFPKFIIGFLNKLDRLDDRVY